VEQVNASGARLDRSRKRLDHLCKYAKYSAANGDTLFSIMIERSFDTVMRGPIFR
jgi:hypothetical protein